MKISKKREAGEILERGGISSRIIALAQDIAEGTYKNAIERAGQIAVLVDAASYDNYWDEKAAIGKIREQNILADLIDGRLDRGKVHANVNPYKQSSATNQHTTD